MTTETPARDTAAETAPEAGTLIIGASQSGVQLAISLRGTGDEEPITLLGDEAHRPLSLIHISEPTRLYPKSRMPSSA